jgi:hypothetical protein
MMSDPSEGFGGCVQRGDQLLSLCQVEPIGRYRLDGNGEQLNRNGQIPRHRRRLESLTSSVREVSVRDFVE